MKTGEGKKIVNCKTCKYRDICKTPCEALKKALDRSVYRHQKELTVGVPVYSKMAWQNLGKFKPLARMEKIYLTLDACGFPRSLIAEVFDIKEKSLTQMIYMAKKKLQK